MKNSNEEKISKNRKYNQKLYKLYKMLSWDLLFFYAISFLFLTQVKELSTSQILFADAFYPLFKILFQIPCTILIEKIGKKNSLILGNLSVVAYVLIVLGLNSTTGYIISNIFCAIGYTIKTIVEPNMLYDSIENTENKRNVFSKIDGFSSSLYYYFDAITATSAGFLFVINPYLPMLLCLFITILSVILSCKFKHTRNTHSSYNAEDDTEPQYTNLSIIKQFQYYFSDLKQAFKFILKSNRLRALILFNAVFMTFTSIMITMRRSLLSELNVPEQYFGIIFAIWGLIAGFASNAASKIHKSFGNQTLTVLGITYCVSIFFAGFVAILPALPMVLVYFFVLVCFTMHSILCAPYYTLIKQYLGSFSTSTMRTKILSATLLIESLSRTIISFFISGLTDNFSSAVSTLIMSIGFTLLILWVLSYMKTRVGLKPEDYPSSDINFTELY